MRIGVLSNAHGRRTILLIRALAELRDDPRALGVEVVVSGHSHKAACETRDGVLYFNPGSAGSRRFKLPVTLGSLRIAAGRVIPSVVTLEPDNRRSRT